MDALLEGTSKNAVRLADFIMIECCGKTSIFAARFPLFVLVQSLAFRSMIHVAEWPIVLTGCPFTSKEKRQSSGNA
jgi:hypothetical protein